MQGFGAPGSIPPGTTADYDHIGQIPLDDVEMGEPTADLTWVWECDTVDLLEPA